MPRIRVLIADDSAVMRRLIAEALSSDPELEVVGSAPNGRIACAKVPLLNPDVVTLDVEMPEMDGLQTLAALHKSHPRLPILMFSSQTERGASITLEALFRGASDYATKPAGTGDLGASLQCLRQELAPKIKALHARHHHEPGGPAAPASRPENAGLRLDAPLHPHPPATPGEPQVVAIGVSTGGPNALAELLPALPATFPVPVVIVQHMPPIFTRLLADRLSHLSALPVREAVNGYPLQPGQAWIAPGDYHLEVLAPAPGDLRLRTHQGPSEQSCRPSVDVLFRSVAHACGPGGLAIVLTGMGHDGLNGCRLIKAAGGQVLVQDAATSVVWGMPGAVAKAALAERIVPLGQLAQEITRRVRRGGGPRPAEPGLPRAGNPAAAVSRQEPSPSRPPGLAPLTTTARDLSSRTETGCHTGSGIRSGTPGPDHAS